jgi:DNA-binding NtrC family response regulator
MKSGAYDFLQKPIEPDQLVLIVRRALEHGRLSREVRRLRDAEGRRQGGRLLVGSSASMQDVRRMIEQVAPTDATVLVSGESGTGKELVASRIHALSTRCDRSLVLVNCAAIPETLFESEFFGHRRGAFSGAERDREGRFAEAEGGTLVLDEVHTLGANVQAKLLRVLETGEFQMVGESRTRRVDVRIVAVTKADLELEGREGGFRSDLYWRLNVFPVQVPPLREHAEDIPELAADLSTRIVARLGIGSAPLTITPAALALMRAYGWPGNVRELRNVLERAAILTAPDGEVTPDVLHPLLGASGSSRGADASALNLRGRLDALEQETIREALTQAQGSKKEAARLLGIDPKNLSYYLRKHDLGETPT